MFNFNKSTFTIDEIEGSKRGALTTRLVYDNLKKNDYKLWFITNKQLSTLFYIVDDKIGTAATLAFTDSNIAMNYINSEDKLRVILAIFGNEITVARRSLFKVQEILDETNIGVLSTIAVNPNDTNGFTPVMLEYFRKMLFDNRITIDIAESMHEIENITLSYNNEEKMYEKVDNIQGSYGSMDIDQI